jgi:hypothetical protein
MGQISGLERDYFRGQQLVALMDGRLYRASGNLPLAVGEFLYGGISPGQAMVWSIENVAWIGNFTISLYEGGSVGGVTTDNQPISLNRVNNRPFNGTVVNALSGSGGTVDLTGATLLARMVIDESNQDQGGVAANAPDFVITPDYDYTIVVENTSNTSNQVFWYSNFNQLTFT